MSATTIERELNQRTIAVLIKAFEKIEVRGRSVDYDLANCSKTSPQWRPLISGWGRGSWFESIRPCQVRLGTARESSSFSLIERLASPPVCWSIE